MMRRIRPAAPESVRLVGIIGYVALLAAGYYYNLTFVQLGLIDLGTRVEGMSARNVSRLKPRN